MLRSSTPSPRLATGPARRREPRRRTKHLGPGPVKPNCGYAYNVSAFTDLAAIVVAVLHYRGRSSASYLPRVVLPQHRVERTCHRPVLFAGVEIETRHEIRMFFPSWSF